MAKRYDRTCSQCGKIENTFSKSPICEECFFRNKHLSILANEKAQLTTLGYRDISDYSHNTLGKRIYTITNPNCNHTFTTRYDNLTNVIKRTGVLLCGLCGRQENMKKTLAKYVERYGKTYDVNAFEDYKDLVRAATEETYQQHIDTLNPNGNRRGRRTFHLDHKVPIAICFKSGISVEKAASLENLILLSSKDNLSKSAYSYNSELLVKLGGTVLDDIQSILADISLELKKHTRDTIIRGYSLIVEDKFRLIVKSDDVSISNTHDNTTFVVRESELRKKTAIVKSRFINLCGFSTRVHARKTVIREVDTQTARKFCDDNHLQAFVGASIKYGLFFNEKLVSLMTFGVPRFSKIADWELIRFCNLIGTSVVGAASKLMTHFIKHHSPTSILSYADTRWSSGNLYTTLGFSEVKKTPSYFYVSADGNLLSRYQAQKHKLSALIGANFDDAKTELENMKEAGYVQVKEPGQITYIKIFGYK